MRDFTQLIWALDQETKSTSKINHILEYFKKSSPGDSAWAFYLLSGRTIPRGVSSTELREWISEVSALPLWLIEESYDSVGDLAETISLLLSSEPSQVESKSEISLQSMIEEKVTQLKKHPNKKEIVIQTWLGQSRKENFVFNKLITGGFRIGAGEGLVVKALSKLSEVEEEILKHRLMGEWIPDEKFWIYLISKDIDSSETSARPYPFFLASPVENLEAKSVDDYQVEWKWDGIRAQLVVRDSGVFIWSRGGENLTERFPEITELGRNLPIGTVLDGEILAWRGEGVLPFSILQTRITRKKVSKALLKEAPVVFLVYDLLEEAGIDLRQVRQYERRSRLEKILISSDTFRLSPLVHGSSWDELRKIRASSRDMKVEGLMLKRLDSVYGVGRERGAWWKWKIDPLTIDAVLIYAQKGHGRRSDLFTDYTFGVWKDSELVPIAKAYSGLTDQEILEVDKFIRKNTVERFGPVRTVKAELVFELAFEGIQKSPRHKSGVALRFPRMLRWRTDKGIQDADKLEQILVENGLQ